MNEYEYEPHGGYDPDFDDMGRLSRGRGYYDEPAPRNQRRGNPDRLAAPDARQPDDKGRRTAAGPTKGAGTNRQAQAVKPSAAKKTRQPFRWNELGIVKFMRDRRFHAVLGVALVFVAVYVAVAAISFMRSGSQDQSLLARQTVQQIVTSGQPVENAAGPVGARLAQSVIVEGLGLGAVALVGYFVLLGLSLIGARKTSFWSLTFKTLLIAITVSMVFGFLSLWFGSEFSYGGYHGHYINVLLVANADWIGAALVSLLLVVAVFYVYINDLAALYKRWRSMRRANKAREEQQRIEADEARERVRRAMMDADEAEQEAEKARQHLDDEAPDVEQPVRPAVSLGFDMNERPEDIYAIGPDAVSPSVKTEAPLPAEHDELPAQRPDAKPIPEHEAPVKVPEVHVSVPEADSRTIAEAPAHGNGMPGLDVVSNSIEEANHTETDLYDPTAELSHYKLPPLDILKEIPVKGNTVDMEEQEENKELIIHTLNNFGIGVKQIKATVGPTVTLYEIVPAEGVRLATIKRLEDDIAMSLSALATRIIAPIPGKGTLGIEVPNKDPQTVSIRSILGSKKYQECKYQLPMAMGATISNEVYIADLAKMPHLLVAGATGMGKSVGLNTIIASLLYKKHPAELKFVLIDPKTVEFSLYNVLENHYLAKLPDQESAVVTSMKNVLMTLNSLVVEMENRYTLLRDANVRSILEYNDKFVQKRLNPEKGHRYLPYIVVIIDEFCDLIMTAGKEVEKPIVRFAQMARAVGMHMIIATQRPSTNVITGIIKANFPGRIAFRVMQMVDSKTILDRTGANQLIGKGDMLFSSNGVMERVQCAFIDTPEVEAICQHIDSQAGYPHAYLLPEPQMETEESGISVASAGDRDPLFEEIAEYVVGSGVASTSSLQRRYNIGFNRAGRIMDQLEAAGIVGPAQGGKPRALLVDAMQLNSILHSL